MTVQATRLNDNKDSDMTFQATRVHDNKNPDSNEVATALMFEQALGSFISAITGGRSGAPSAMLFGIDSGESIRFTLVCDAESAYELLKEQTSIQAANKHEIIALVVNGRVEATRHEGGETSSDVTEPARVRITFLSGKHNTLTIMRFADGEVLFPDGVGHGPLNDALAEFWASSAN